jgi:two-component system NtrC family sensor kinase
MVEESLRNDAARPSSGDAADDGAKKTLGAFLERPAVSIRARIAAAFLLMFVLLCGVAVTAMLFISKSKAKLQFLEQIGNYRAELQQARRFEKDFFLYGTDLPDALANAHMAKDHLERSAKDIESVIGAATYRDMEASVTEYAQLLERLLETSAGKEPEQSAEQREIEILLRRHGAKILADADEMIDRERMDIRSILHTSMLAAVGFMFFMLFIMAYIANFLIRSVLRPLGRFVQYATRIGAGDYSPIVPTRKYRDEFSNLAIAINEMLSDLVLRQEELTQSGKMAAVGTLTSGIAHELNNPLNNIGITTEALIENYPEYSDEDRLRMLDQIYTQVERASGTVRNLLDFTRKEQSVFTTVSVPEIVKATARLVGNELKLGGIELSLDVEDELPEIKGNPRNLQQVFLNLFLNAIQAMPEGGRLGVRALKAGDGFLRVDVSDTGPGIPAEHLDKIFEPFFTTKDPGRGTGLGLSVAYATVEAHHGRIIVESKVGKGTTFSVFLRSGTNTSSQPLRRE